jgi:hypothetical protein
MYTAIKRVNEIVSANIEKYENICISLCLKNKSF